MAALEVDQTENDPAEAKITEAVSSLLTILGEFSISTTGDLNITANKIAVMSDPTPRPVWNAAADLLQLGYARFQEALRFEQKGDEEQAKLLKDAASQILLSAMEVPGIEDLVIALDQINSNADFPQAVNKNLGIDPDLEGEALDTAADDDNADDTEDQADDGQPDGGQEQAATDMDVETIVAKYDYLGTRALLNKLSVSGRNPGVRLGSELLKSLD